MKTANKIIMSGLAAFLISCSEVSTTPDMKCCWAAMGRHKNKDASQQASVFPYILE